MKAKALVILTAICLAVALMSNPAESASDCRRVVASPRRPVVALLRPAGKVIRAVRNVRKRVQPVRRVFRFLARKRCN